MKENGMEKLIKLLNEYLETFDIETNKILKVFAFEEATKLFLAKNGVSYRQERVISKRFEFIKWLIKNYHIELPMGLWVIKSYSKEEGYNYFEDYESLLMLLSIQENPIKLLISLLK